MPEAPEPKSGGLFKKAPKKEAAPAADQNITEEINTLSRRIRIIEDHIDSMRRKVQLDEHNQLTTRKRLASEVKTVTDEFNDLRREIEDMKRMQTTIIKEIGLCAKKEKLDVLQRYLDMWEPIKFVTRKEVENIIRDILEETKEPQQ